MAKLYLGGSGGSQTQKLAFWKPYGKAQRRGEHVCLPPARYGTLTTPRKHLFAVHCRADSHRFQELEGCCCVPSTFTHDTRQLAVFHTITCLLTAFTPTRSPSSEKLTRLPHAAGGRDCGTARSATRRMTHSQTRRQRTLGFAVAHHSGLIPNKA